MKTRLSELWSKTFDQIYCIHYLPYKSRLVRLNSELSRVGILDSNVFSWKFTFDSPFYEKLRNVCKLVNDVQKTNINFFKVSLAHYAIYREAIEQGFKRILVLENDVVFLKDLNELVNIISNFPFDYDVVLLDKFVYNPYQYACHCRDNKQINSHYIPFFSNSQHFGSAACYSVSEKAMSVFSKIQEKGMLNPDEVWNYWGFNEIDELKRAFSITNICYQKPFDEENSITPANNNMLAYKFVNLNTEKYN